MGTLDEFLPYHHMYQSGDQQQAAPYINDPAASVAMSQCLYQPMHSPKTSSIAIAGGNGSSSGYVQHSMNSIAHGHNGHSNQSHQQHSPSSGGGHLNYGQAVSYHAHGGGLSSPMGSPRGVAEQQPVVTNYNSYATTGGGNNTHHHEVVNVSNTLTHISETDSSTANYPTPPLSQNATARNATYQTPPARFNSFQAQLPVVTSGAWQTASAHPHITSKAPGGGVTSKANQQLQHYASNSNANFHRPYETSRGHQQQQQQHYHLSQPQHRGDYSITSTPVCSKESKFGGTHAQTLPKVTGGANGYYYNQSTMVANAHHQHQQHQHQNTPKQQSQQQHQQIQLQQQQHTPNNFGNGLPNLSITKEKTTTQVANDTNELMPDGSVTRQEFQRALLPPSANGSGSSTAGQTLERRNVIILKVIDQLIDPTTKRVMKETVVKNDEFITPCGLVHVDSGGCGGVGYDSLATSCLSTLNRSMVGSSGNLADFSSNLVSKSSVEGDQSSSGEPSVLASETIVSRPELCGVQLTSELLQAMEGTKTVEVANTTKVVDVINNVGDEVTVTGEVEEEDLDEETTAATALLSLNTPVKVMVPPGSPLDVDDGPLRTPTFPRASEAAKVNFNNILGGVGDEEPKTIASPTTSIGSLSTNPISTSASTSNSPKLVAQSAGKTGDETAVGVAVYGCLKQNMKVLAKWKDRKYYPAILSRKADANKWAVKFEDGASHKLGEVEMVRLEGLAEGMEVMVNIGRDMKSDDGSMICQVGTIERVFPPEDDGDDYEFELEHVDRENGGRIRKHYKLGEIFLNGEQGSTITARMGKPSVAVFGEVDLDNIVTGKRSRGKLIEATTTIKKNKDKESEVQAAVLYPAPSGGRKRIPATESRTSSIDSNSNSRRKRRRQEVLDKVEEAKVPEAVVTEAEKLSMKMEKPRKKRGRAKAVPVEVKQNAAEVVVTLEATAAPERATEGNEQQLSSEEMQLAHVSPIKSVIPPSELIRTLGPMPKIEGLFARYVFMLTQGDRIEHACETRSDPFDKAYLSKQIRAGGGRVFETFDEMRATNLDCILIADTYHRSVEYLQCLAGGVPILSHLWVIESCRAGKLQPKEAHLLPAGYDEITHTLSSDKNAFKKSSTLFRDAKIYFGSSQPARLERNLLPILKAARAVVVAPQENIHIILTKKLVDIIVADGSCPQELLTRAKSTRVPVTSPEYIIQCLINGKRLSADASPMFAHTYQLLATN